MTSWQVRLAALLVWLGVLPGLGCLYLSALAFRNTDDMLLFVMPIVASAALMAGVLIFGGAVTLALRLHQGHAVARLQTLIAGLCFAGCGLFVLAVSPLVGLGLVLYGGTLAWLVSTPAAAQDLGPWRRAVQQPAPWGSTPGTKLWAPAPRPAQLHPSVEAGPVQGPWAPDPRTLPWLSWKGHSGPRAPWWQTWQAGLAQGIPLWELIVLFVALVCFVVGLIAVPFAVGGSHVFSTLHVEDGAAGRFLWLIPLSIGVVAWLERRMRTRLATRR